MSFRILVAYASRAGSTAEVAKVIGEMLRQRDAEVDVRSVKETDGVAGYDALVLGTAIWIGKPLPEARAFAEANRDALASLPVAYFVLCGTLREDTTANRDRVRGYLKPLVALKQPVGIGLFAGARDFHSVHPFWRWFWMRVVRLAEGDWRDWGQIRGWACELATHLAIPEHTPGVRPPSAPVVAASRR